MKTQFVNAQQQHKNHPNTFEVPPKQDLDQLKVGDYVKVSTGGERFWVTLTGIGETLTGTVENDLICTDTHGLKFGDTVEFNRDNVYDIY